MNKIIALAIVLILIGLFASTKINSNTIEVTNTQPIATTTQVVIEKDNVTEAQKQLDAAKKMLDEEDAQIVAEVAKLEARREEIRKVRLSFSQAPKPVE